MSVESTPLDGKRGQLKVEFDPELRDELKRLAKLNDRSLGGEIRFALRQHLERHKAEKATIRGGTL